MPTQTPLILFREMIKVPTAFGRWLAERFQSMGQQKEEEPNSQHLAGRGETLLQLHQTQNRIIHGIYKISISGFIAIFMILLSFTLFLMTDPETPGWLAGALVVAELLLVAGFLRTYRDFRQYQKHYREVSVRLRDLLQRYLATTAGKGGEHRLIAALRPKTYSGWDAKPCRRCSTPIEMGAEVCQHCGKSQAPSFVN